MTVLYVKMGIRERTGGDGGRNRGGVSPSDVVLQPSQFPRSYERKTCVPDGPIA